MPLSGPAETSPPAGEIAAAFDAYDSDTRSHLMELRAIIFDTARHIEGLGELAETLKWGQPSYTPKKRGIGSSVRLATTEQGEPALFFICHTKFIERFRDHYGNALRLEGNRAVVLDGNQPLPQEALRHCIAMALTYHLNR